MVLGMELGFTRKGLRALGDLVDGAEPWERRLQPGFSLCPTPSVGCSGLYQDWLCICVGLTPAWELNLSQGAAQASQSRVSRWGLRGRKGAARPCVGGDIPLVSPHSPAGPSWVAGTQGLNLRLPHPLPARPASLRPPAAEEFPKTPPKSGKIIIIIKKN